MTLNELRQKADPILADFWLALKPRQDAYFAKHGKYFQLLVSPTTEVKDGVDSGFAVRKPSDEVHTIDVTVPWATKIPFQIQVHEWVGPQGNGYQAIVSVKVGEDIYMRSRTSTNVDSGWYKYVPLILA